MYPKYPHFRPPPITLSQQTLPLVTLGSSFDEHYEIKIQINVYGTVRLSPCLESSDIYVIHTTHIPQSPRTEIVCVITVKVASENWLQVQAIKSYKYS